MFRKTDNFLIILLFIFLLAGQWGRIDLAPGITLYLADLAIVILFFRLITLLAIRRQVVLTARSRSFVFIGVTFSFSLVANIWRLLPLQFFVSALYLVRFLTYLTVCFTAAKISSTRYWLRSLAAFGTSIAVTGLIQLALLPDMRQLSYLGFDPHYYRLVSTLFDPNFTAIILALTVLLLIHLRNEIKMKVWLSAVIVNLVALLLTYSRGGYLALLSGLIVYSVMRKKFAPALAVMGTFILFSLIPKLNFESLDLWRVTTVWSRWQNLKEGLGWFAKAPIFGWGFNTLRFTVNDPRALETVVTSRALSGFDNSFVFILVTTGLVGFISYVYFWFYALKPIIKRANKPFALLLLPTFSAILIHAQIINSLFYPAVMVFAFILLGLSMRKENWR